ncbi:MAG: hypothetical protein QG602_1937 [Verrucomicrobiota bacterium]|nr:hypothetical protein [Verrucomicrobiota bacterium]
MKLPPLPLLLAALLTGEAAAQVSSPPPPTSGTARSKQTSTAKPVAKGKAVLPDPDLLDGSKYEPEKRPLYGMISEIEMGEEQNEQADKVGPSLPQPALPGLPGLPSLPSGGASGGGQPSLPQIDLTPESGQGGSSQTAAQGPQSEAAGAQAQSLQGQPQQGGPQPTGARDMKIGDATLQIQTVPQTPDTVGNEPSKAQQYEKPVPPGQQGNNRNQGVEKGKVIPKGL